MEWDTRQKMGAGAAAGIALLVLGGGWVAANHKTEPAKPIAATFDEASESNEKAGSPAPIVEAATPTPEASPKTIRVFVSGAVKRPGVYELKSGDRIQHAILAAGGFKPNAVIDAINLADYARDSDQYTIPAKTIQQPTRPKPESPQSLIVRGSKPAPTPTPKAVGGIVTPPVGRVLGKTPQPGAATEPFAVADAASGDQETGRESASPSTLVGTRTEKFKSPGEGVVNLNTATSEELQRLPGVGASTAEKIVAYRQEIGQFTSMEQMLDVKGIGAKKLEKMRPFLSVGERQ